MEQHARPHPPSLPSWSARSAPHSAHGAGASVSLPLDLVADLETLPFDVYVRRASGLVLYAAGGSDADGLLKRARDGVELIVADVDAERLRGLLLTSLVRTADPREGLVADRAVRAAGCAGLLLAPLFAPRPTIDRVGLRVAMAAIDLLVRAFVEDGFGRAMLARPPRVYSPTRRPVDRAIDGLVYAIALARATGWPAGDSPGPDGLSLFGLGRGVALRDVGQSRMAGQERGAGRANRDALQRHPIVSVDLLAEALGGSPGWGRVIAEHHERSDGSGYPAGLHDGRLSTGGRIAALADVFVAILSPQAQRGSVPASEAIRLLRFVVGGRFPDELLVAFVGILADDLLPGSPVARLPV